MIPICAVLPAGHPERGKGQLSPSTGGVPALPSAVAFPPHVSRSLLGVSRSPARLGDPGGQDRFSSLDLTPQTVGLELGPWDSSTRGRLRVLCNWRLAVDGSIRVLCALVERDLSLSGILKAKRRIVRLFPKYVHKPQSSRRLVQGLGWGKQSLQWAFHQGGPCSEQLMSANSFRPVG